MNSSHLTAATAPRARGKRVRGPRGGRPGRPEGPSRGTFAAVVFATLCSFLAVGAVLPILPGFVRGPLGAGDLAVGVVVGAYTATALVGRPFAGRAADRRGRRRVLVAGSLCVAAAGALYLVPAGVGGLLLARLVLGAGEALVVSAGGAWVVDLSPPGRRGQAIGLFGLGIWGGIAAGPLVGQVLLALGGYPAVWVFAGAVPLLGATALIRAPDRRPAPAAEDTTPGRLLPRPAIRPGVAIALGSVGFATLAGFGVLHLEASGAGHGTLVFSLFAATVVGARLVAGKLPDRLGASPTAVAAAAAEAGGLALIGLATSWPLAAAGAVLMGLGFSVLYPALALIVVDGTDEREHGAALGTYSAFFDAGVGLGAPLAGAVAVTGGYPAAFMVAAICALAGVVVTARAPTERSRTPGEVAREGGCPA